METKNRYSERKFFKIFGIISFKFLTRLIISIIIIFFLQQVVHEFGHAIMVVLLGGEIKGINFGLSGGNVSIIVPNIPSIILAVNLSGGLFASLFLLGFYLCTRKFWVEFNIMTYTFLFMNLIIAFIEGFLNELYLQNLGLWSYLMIPFFFLSVILFKHRLVSQFKEASKGHFVAS